MKAAIFYAPGDVRIEDVPRPEAGDGEIVIKVESALTCGTDVKTWIRGHPMRKGPGTFGHECSGIVVETGSGVYDFKIGDRVAVHNTAPCDACYYCRSGKPSICNNLTMLEGAFAEYVRIPAPIVKKNTFKIPDHISFKAAALLEPLSCAVYGATEAGIKLGDIVVVNGAGPIGLMITQCAIMLGAHVICCDLSQDRLNLAKELGAQETIRITSDIDQVDAVRSLTPDKRGVDVAIEAVGLPEIWEKTVLMTRRGGNVLLFGGCKPGTTITLDTKLLHYSQLTIKGVFHTTPWHVNRAFDLICRKVVKPEQYISKTYCLDDIIEAIESHARQECIKNEIVCG